MKSMLYRGEMVRSIAADTKTQTRRIAKHQPPDDVGLIQVGRYHPTIIVKGEEEPGEETFGAYDLDGLWGLPCPYGAPGDKLAVRETFWAFGRWETRFDPKKGRDAWHFVDMTTETGHAYHYDADEAKPLVKGKPGDRGGVTPKWWKRPAIFMPARAVRYFLEVTAVRVERLQAISETDARAEGVEYAQGWEEEMGEGFTGGYGYRDYLKTDDEDFGCRTARDSYRTLWESINGPGSWDANEWVWVIEFKRINSGEA